MPFSFSSQKWRSFLQISLSLLETGERNFRVLFLFSKLEKRISNFSFSSRLDFLASRQCLLPGPFRGSKQPKCEYFHFWGPFWPPLSPGNSRDGPNCIKNTSTQCAWVGRIHIMHLGPLKDLYGPQKGSFWLQKALLGAPEVLGGPWGPDLVPTAPHWPA